MLRCKHCGFQATTFLEESKIEYHHIIPKSLGGTDISGRIPLCKKCHDKLHYMIPRIMWSFIPFDNQKEIKKFLIYYTNVTYKKY